MSIEQKSINMNGVWKVASPLAFAKFRAEALAFAADETIGLTKKEVSKIEIKVKFEYFTSAGDYKGCLVSTNEDLEKYSECVSLIGDQQLAQAFAGMGGVGTEDLDCRSWTYRFNCKLGADTFQVNFHRDRVVIENYSNNDTKTALEAYFATRPNLAQPSA